MATVQIKDFNNKWINVTINYVKIEDAYSAMCQIKANHKKIKARIKQIK